MASQNDDNQTNQLQAQLNTIEGIFQKEPSPWINGTAIGFLPAESAAAPGDNAPVKMESNVAVAPAPQILVFVDPGAPDCETAAIERKVQAVPGVQVLRVSRFLGLQATSLINAGDSIGTYAPFRYNLPLVNAGTLGARVSVTNNNEEFGLSSNHVLAHNGRALEGTPIATPGPVDEVSATPVIGGRSYFVPFEPATWPYKWPGQQPFNHTDCALSKSPQPGTIDAPTQLKIFSLSPPPAGSLPALSPVSVTKKGRATGQTSSSIKIFYLSTYIGFTFGTYYFKGLLGTFDENHYIFAAPGDSGAMVVLDPSTPPPAQGVGLVTARAYVLDKSKQFLAYIIAVCPLETVANELATEMSLSPDQLNFWI